MKKIERQKRAKTFIDLTPLIDVVFQLLIFFLVASNFTITREVSTEIPLGKGETVEQDKINYSISLKENGEFFFNDKLTNFRKLEAILEKISLKKNASIYFYGHRSIEYQKFIRIMELVDSKGISNFFIVKQKK